MDFVFEKAGSVAEALMLKAKYGEEGVFLAGGTDLLVDMRNKILEPKAVIDISVLEEINYIQEEGSQIKIGAGTKIAEIQKSSTVLKDALILHKACQELANPLVKNRASLGGNLVNASPAADMATPLLVLGAEVVLSSINRERVLPLENFFLGVKKTNQRSDELLTEVRFHKANTKIGEFLKLGQRNGTSISIASLSIVFQVMNGLIQELCIALGSVAPVPMRAYKTEEALHGNEPSLENIEQASEVLKSEVKPITDIRGSEEYRREVCAMLLLMSFHNLGLLR